MPVEIESTDSSNLSLPALNFEISKISLIRSSRCCPRAVDVPGILTVFLASGGTEQLIFHDFGKSEDCIER